MVATAYPDLGTAGGPGRLPSPCPHEIHPDFGRDPLPSGEGQGWGERPQGDLFHEALGDDDTSRRAADRGARAVPIRGHPALRPLARAPIWE